MIKLVKQPDCFCASIYPEDDENCEDEYIEVTEETYNKLLNRELMWANGELVENPDYKDYEKEVLKWNKFTEIQQYKSLLQMSDYKAIKYAEGLISKEEYLPIKQERQSYRDKINELEEELKEL